MRIRKISKAEAMCLLRFNTVVSLVTTNLNCRKYQIIGVEELYGKYSIGTRLEAYLGKTNRKVSFEIDYFTNILTDSVDAYYMVEKQILL